MLLDQAIIMTTGSATSTESRKWIVSKSDGIDDPLATTVLRHSPDRNGLASGASEAIGFYAIENERFVFSRSTFGRKVNRDGSRALMTHIIVVNADQLIGFENNAVLLMQQLLSSGSLYQSFDTPERLSQIEIEETSFFVSHRWPESENGIDLESLRRAIEIHQNVVIPGLADPLPLLNDFLFKLPVDVRTKFSFSSGLKLNDENRFTIQFFANVDPMQDQEFAKQQVRVIKLAKQQTAKT